MLTRRSSGMAEIHRARAGIGNDLAPRRLATLRAHIEAGGRYDLELGCGNGGFAAGLADRTNRWVLGIDVVIEWSPSYASPRYEDKLVILDEMRYAWFLEDLEGELSWLQGAAERTFLIFPFPFWHFKKPSDHPIRLGIEAEIWRKVASPRGELHVRTESHRLTSIIRHQFPECKEMLFAAEADGIPSPWSKELVPLGILQRGWKLP